MSEHLRDMLPFLINRIAARVSDAATQEFSQMGLNAFAGRVLILLHLDGPSTVGALAENAALDQSTLSHILRRLDAQGLLIKQRQDHDNRSVLVSLTDDGKRVAAVCYKTVQRHDAMLRTGIAPEDWAALKAGLIQLYANVPFFEEQVASGLEKAATDAENGGPVASREPTAAPARKKQGKMKAA
jgi:DNA-binding MarR family transcriptional regulator